MQAWEEIEYARQEERFELLSNLVKQGLLSVEVASTQAGVTEKEFLAKIEKYQ